MLGQQGDVLLALAQGRDADGQDVQAVEQVHAEALVLDGLLEVGVGRGDDSDVDGLRLGRADARDLARLESAQQRRLGGQGHVADLVEEQRAAVRRFEVSDASLVGAREAALLVPEQFGLDQLVGDRRAVDRDEGSLRAGTRQVQVARGDLLAGAVLPEQEDGHVGVGRALQVPGNLAPGRALAHGFPAAAQLALELAVLPLQGPRAQGVREADQEPVLFERLLQEVRRATADGVHRQGHVGVAGDHHHGRSAGAVSQGFEQLEPVHPRHLHVREDQVGALARRGLALQALEGLLAAFGGPHPVALVLQDHLHGDAHVGFVVDHQDGGGRLAALAHGAMVARPGRGFHQVAGGRGLSSPPCDVRERRRGRGARGRPRVRGGVRGRVRARGPGAKGFRGRGGKSPAGASIGLGTRRETGSPRDPGTGQGLARKLVAGARPGVPRTLEGMDLGPRARVRRPLAPKTGWGSGRGRRRIVPRRAPLGGHRAGGSPAVGA